MTRFENTMTEVNNLLIRAAEEFDRLPKEEKQKLIALLVTALTVAASTYSQVNNMNQLSSISREQSKLKLTGAINQANNYGANINPLDILGR